MGGLPGSGIRASDAPGEDLADPAADPAALPRPAGPPLELGHVLASVYTHYPLLDAAYRDRAVASGYQLAAEGSFDTKVKANSDNQPLYYYKNYVQKVAIDQPLYGGGEVFGQYRIGRGSFEPWYLERGTNGGGEFRAGLLLPLLQGREIDARRADLWKSNLERARVEPEIRRQLLAFTQDAAYAYWDWVAAGRYYGIARAMFENAETRAAAIGRRVAEGDLEPLAEAENERLILSRRAALIDAERKLATAAIKLSLFLRDDSGRPCLPDPATLPAEFPTPTALSPERVEPAVEQALAVRPELQSLAFERRKLVVDRRWAENQRLPDLDAGIVGAQDVGDPTSPKRDKSRFELEVGLALDTPLQFRKARGYAAIAEGKLAQLNAKTRFTRDKVAAEVRAAAVAVTAAGRRFDQAARSLELAGRLEDADRRRFSEGEIDLFALNLREQLTADAAASVVTAQLDYHRSLADFCAAVGEPPPVTPIADSGWVPPAPADEESI